MPPLLSYHMRNEVIHVERDLEMFSLNARNDVEAFDSSFVGIQESAGLYGFSGLPRHYDDHANAVPVCVANGDARLSACRLTDRVMSIAS